MIESLDHLVLTVSNLDATRRFYCDGLGMQWITFGENRIALKFGQQKINLHQVCRTFEPKAARPTPGSADLCFLTDRTLDEVIKRMADQGFDSIEGPVIRTGARFNIRSIYYRDPDENLIEISHRSV